ncbi:MAG TPA: hypothetical protein VN819_02465 [Thermoplasmata archaeon]|nr:hypothetical protein [Thermoplasmata archaeon]
MTPRPTQETVGPPDAPPPLGDGGLEPEDACAETEIDELAKSVTAPELAFTWRTPPIGAMQAVYATVLPALELRVPSATDESHHEKFVPDASGAPQAFLATAENISTSRGVAATFAGVAVRVASKVSEQF